MNIYRVYLKMFQHENYDISEMHVYFCTELCPFVYKTTVQKCAALCCIYLTYAELTETQTSGTNFATAQKVDVIKVSLNERPVPSLLRRQCDVVILFKFWMLINVLVFFIITICPMKQFENQFCVFVNVLPHASKMKTDILSIRLINTYYL